MEEDIVLVNVGCGNRFDTRWRNFDLNPAHPSVFRWNAAGTLNFDVGSVDGIYHSHMIEHLSPHEGIRFLSECLRVLKVGGCVRVVFPDLEAIARNYLVAIEFASEGRPGWEDNYDWMMLELFDQMIREKSGGRMMEYLARPGLPNRDFLLARCGREISDILSRLAFEASSSAGYPPIHEIAKPSAASSLVRRLKNSIKKRISRRLFRRNPEEIEAGLKMLALKQSGELHQWMYDRFSMGRLLRQVGFVDVRLVSATESRIPDWQEYLLDADAAGVPHKPDSAYMEAVKP